MLLKYAHRSDLLNALRLILEALRPMPLDESGLMRLQAILVYLASAAPHLQPEQVAGILESTFPEKGKVLMATMAEQWMNQGMEKGMVKGMEKGMEKGREEGRLIGTIQTCAEILGQSIDESALREKSQEELQQFADDLQKRVREAFGTR